MVIQDVGGPEGDHLQPEIREPLRQAGVVSHLVTPFGVGSEMLGIIAAERLQAGQPWTAAEVDAVESIAADLGRGLRHARLYEEENRLVEELRSIDRTKSDFVATVSHELRTPLASITGYTEMLLDREMGELSAEQERTLERVSRNAVRLQDLIEDLLTLSAIEAGTFTTVARPINLLDIIAGAAEDIAPAVTAKGLTLTTALPADGLPADGMVVDGDANQLVRVLMNLLSNAVKFTPEDGRIELTTVTADGWAVRVGGRYRHRDPGGGQEGSFHPLLPGLERDAAGHSGYRSRPVHHPGDHRRPRRRAEPSIAGRHRHHSHRAAPPRPHRGPRGTSRPPTPPIPHLVRP